PPAAKAPAPATPTVQAPPSPTTQAPTAPSAPSTTESAARQNGRVIHDCDACPEMIALPAGAFQMGSANTEAGHFDTESPQHEVHVAAFAIGKTEVTFAQWDACASAGGCGHFFPVDRGWGRGQRPVVGVSWRDAQQYAAWLSQTTHQH